MVVDQILKLPFIALKRFITVAGTLWRLLQIKVASVSVSDQQEVLDMQI